MPKPKGGTALVVGGAGFLGRHIAAQLLASRRYSAVRVFDIRPAGLEGAEEVVGDLRKAEDVAAAVEGARVARAWVFILGARACGAHGRRCALWACACG